MQALRVIAAGFRFHLKSTLRSHAQIVFLVVVPVVYATLGFYVFRSGGNRESLLWIALGAGIMGIWSTTLVGSGMALQRERWAGTLEVLISAPPRFVYVLTGVTLATSAIGVYSLAASLAWGMLVFDVPLGLEHPLAFAVAVPVTVVSLGLFGLVLAATFVLYRQTFALTNLLEYPVWLVAGLLVPLALLPAWLQPVAWFIAPTWGVRAIREATLGGSPWPELGLCVLLAIGAMALGAFLLGHVERLARQRATLALT